MPVLALGLALPSPTASAAPSGPACAPSTLDNSALQAGVVTVSPLAGSHDASPQTQISFLGAPAGELSAISVVGSRTGAHSGRLAAYSERDGASFLPSSSFAEGELVTVRARLRRGRSMLALLDRFSIASQDSISSTPEAIHPGSPSEVQSFHSRPDLQPPTVTVTTRSPGLAPGDAFLAPYTGPGEAGPMILDQDGGLLWFKPLPPHTYATNFMVQQYAGRPVLTWWQGDISIHGFGLGEDVIDDSTYTEIAHVRAGNGEQADLHDFQLTPSGTALITAYHPILCNLSSLGGPAYSAVIDGTMQEVDVRTGLVMYEWTSIDHVALSDSYERARRSSIGFPFDFFHINSLALNPDGSVLISSRNTWAVYDLNSASGQILWSLGGRHTSFAGPEETRTAWQHDPRELPGGEFSIFDNGASPTVHPQSRGIVVRLDPQNGTISLVSQFTHPAPFVSQSQGNMQALSNGNWLIGWGQVPDFSEFGPSGTLLFDAHLPAHVQSYRSFRFPWIGTPVHRPAFAFEPAAAGTGTLYASWNGATQVASWAVLAGPTPTALRVIARVARAAFETAIALPAASAGPYLAVEALDAAGNVLGVSAAASEPTLAPAG